MSNTNLNDKYTDGLVQDCSNSIALAMELMQSCTKPWIQYQIILVLFVFRISMPKGLQLYIC